MTERERESERERERESERERVTKKKKKKKNWATPVHACAFENASSARQGAFFATRSTRRR
jgi:hypothetical protein